MKKNKYCQRCGVPFDNKEFKRGTEKDGSKSTLYCITDYVNGEILYPELTKQDMFNLSMEYAKTNKGVIFRFFFWLMYPIQLNTNSLKYWKDKNDTTKVVRKYKKDDLEKIYKLYPDLKKYK